MGESEDEQMDDARGETIAGRVSHCGQNEAAVLLGAASFRHLTND